MASGLGVLASYAKTPDVAQLSVDLNFLQSLQAFTGVVQTIGQDLAVFSILPILLSVQEPVWDPVPAWILRHGDPTSSSASSPALWVRSMSAFLDITGLFAPRPSLQ